MSANRPGAPLQAHAGSSGVRTPGGTRMCWLVVAVFCALPDAAQACAACFGQSDSRLATGMNWGIFSLLGVVVCVLAGFGVFLIYLVRKSGSAAPAPAPGPDSPS